MLRFFVKVIDDLEMDFVGNVDDDEIRKHVAVILMRISEADMSTFVVDVVGRRLHVLHSFKKYVGMYM